MSAQSSYQSVFGDDPAPDTPAALAFIAKYTAAIQAPTICLTSIIPDGPTDTATFDADDADGQRKWIDARQGQQNIYFTVNVVKGRPTSKPSKDDMAAAVAYWTDLDPRDGRDFAAERIRLRNIIEALKFSGAPPSIVIDSGGGYQLFWFLPKPLPLDGKDGPQTAVVEALGKRLERRFGADNVRNIDRIMRLPGTINLPTEVKRAKGRQRALATLESFAIKRYSLSQLRALSVWQLDGLDALDAALRSKLQDALRDDDKLCFRWQGDVTGLKDKSRSGFDMSATALLKGNGFTLEEVGQVLRLAFQHGVGKDLDDRQIGKMFGDTKGADGRPVIKIIAGDLPNLATAGEQALIAAGEPLFVRGPQVARPVVEDVDASGGRRTKVVRLAAVTPTMLIDRLARVANWTKWSTREKQELPADPPDKVASIILSRDGEWKFRRLAGIITTPTLRRDGSLLAAAGYDPQTRLLVIDPPALPNDMPTVPTKADAEAALELLDGLLSEFPFIDAASKSVGLSAIISPVVRGALAAVPMHIWRAPTAGSSKSFGADVAATVATGQICPVISAGATEEELEKRISAVLMTGQTIACVDNVNGELGGDALCQLIERPTVDLRILGQSNVVRIENRATLFATGNNIRVKGDMVRRVVMASLDANMERPELREFTQNPLAMVLADRGRYVAACLTIVRAYREAGCPDALPALASFSDWSKMVRSALVWLGRADPLLTMELARAEDPELAALQQVVTAWRDAVGTDIPVTAGQLAAHADPALREALQLVAGTQRHGTATVNVKTLGVWLSGRKGRIDHDLKIMGDFDAHAKQQTWRLHPIKPSAAKIIETTEPAMNSAAGASAVFDA